MAKMNMDPKSIGRKSDTVEYSRSIVCWLWEYGAVGLRFTQARLLP